MERNTKESKGISLIILVILVVIIIFAIILGMKILRGNSQENEYTRTKVISLLEKGTNVDNYICDETTTLTIDNNKTEEYTKNTRKLKENKMVVIDRKGKAGSSYFNYENNEVTIIREDKKIAVISSIESKSLTSVKKIYFQDIIDLVNDYNNEYIYIKNEKVNGYDCIKIELKIKNGKAEVWIDTENGLVIRTKYIVLNEETEKITSIDYKVELNCVTDSDVNVPDLKDYKIQKV